MRATGEVVVNAETMTHAQVIRALVSARPNGPPRTIAGDAAALIGAYREDSNYMVEMDLVRAIPALCAYCDDEAAVEIYIVPDEALPACRPHAGKLMDALKEATA